MYYAYLHTRPDKTGPAGIFYVGKGNAARVKKIARKNKHHAAIVAKVGIENVEVCVMECSSEESAFALEVGLIKCLRRMGVELCNATDGGEGASGLTHSAESREKMSAARVGHKPSDETHAKLSAANVGNTNCRGHIQTAEHKANRSASLIGNTNKLGHKHTEATKAKLSAIQRTAGSLRSTNTSGYNGVRPRGRRWTAEISNEGRSIYLGIFPTLEEAVAARKAGEEKYWK